MRAVYVEEDLGSGTIKVFKPFQKRDAVDLCRVPFPRGIIPHVGW